MKITYANGRKSVPYRDIKAGEAWSFDLTDKDSVFMKTDNGDVDLADGETFTGDHKTSNDELVYRRNAHIVIDGDGGE